MFECLCYPWLRLYNTYKVKPKSRPSVFLGYSLEHNVYHCFSLFTKNSLCPDMFTLLKMYFPFKKKLGLHATRVPNALNIWFPSTTCIPTNLSNIQEHFSFYAPQFMSTNHKSTFPFIQYAFFIFFHKPQPTSPINYLKYNKSLSHATVQNNIPSHALCDAIPSPFGQTTSNEADCHCSNSRFLCARLISGISISILEYWFSNH